MNDDANDAVLVSEKLDPIPYFDDEYEAWVATQGYLVQGDEAGL